MKLINKSKRDYWYDKILLVSGQELEIEDEKACRTLLNQEGVEEVINKAEVDKLKKEVAKLKKEKKEVSKPKKAKK